MKNPVNKLDELLRSMTPILNDGVYCFATVNNNIAIELSEIIATIIEPEGLSIIISEQIAEKYNLDTQFKCAWITLAVHSDLAAVGLTAAFATALGKAEISCNIVAGHYHDHIFVPYDKAELAMQVLIDLQRVSRKRLD